MSVHDYQQGKSPVFIYSGFRASSTWLWSKFRAHESMLCYYEPFNEQLGNLTLETIGDARPDGWRSHHPSGAPYVLEYAGLIGEGAGVLRFPESRGLGARYIGAAGPEGRLDEDVKDYVEGLIGHAHGRNRVPLIACTRLLGRAHGLKAAFGGYHILVTRNLFHQWNSYAGQARFGNWYFLQTLFETLGLADRDPIIAYLSRFFPEDTRSSLEAWVTPQNFDRIFCYFVGFHLYFLALARRSADLTLDVNALVGPDPRYRRSIVDRVASDIGIALDLEDASVRVDFPLYPIADRKACIILIDEIAAKIKSSCDGAVDELAFIDGLIADVWSEQEVFQRQTAGAFEYLAHIDACSEARIQERLRDALQEADRQVRQAMAEQESSMHAMEEIHREMMQKDVASGNKVAEMEARLAEQEAALVLMQEAAARERDAAVQELMVANIAVEEKAGQLAATEQALASARDALEETHREMTQKDLDSGSKVAEMEARVAEQEAALALMQEAAARERDAAVQDLMVANIAVEEKAGQLAATEQALAGARDALLRAVENERLVRDHLEAERARCLQRESENAAALTQVAKLQTLLAQAQVDSTALRDRIDQLECSIANVDAINIKLAGRLALVGQAGQGGA